MADSQALVAQVFQVRKGLAFCHGAPTARAEQLSGKLADGGWFTEALGDFLKPFETFLMVLLDRGCARGQVGEWMAVRWQYLADIWQVRNAI